MLDAIKNFIGMYANVNNILICGACVVVFLVILDFIVYLCSYSTLGKMIKCMRNNFGEDVIIAIENIKKSGRYDLMWEDYYDAYKKEKTVSLNSYLLKEDMFVKRHIFKAISRAVVVISIALMIAASVKVTGLLKSEKYDILCGGGLLIGLQCVCEVFFYLIDTAKEKKLKRRLEEFNMLSVRKLPSKAIDFKAMHYIKKINEIYSELQDIYGAVLNNTFRGNNGEVFEQPAEKFINRENTNQVFENQEIMEKTEEQ